jgi:hypothetical protein
MRELEAHGLRATFFVEVLGSAFFGLERLREVCGSLHDRGHDVQLHTHPIQRNAAFLSKGDRPVSDDMAAYDVAAQAAMLREGLDVLVACGIPREQLLAFRAGNFGANNDTWTAMKQAGLLLSSNYNPCYFTKNCRMRHDNARAGLFEAVPGLFELPISNFRDGASYRHVQITAVSAEETRDVLWQARALGIEEVCIVTHSFELCHIDDVVARTGRLNTVNLQRLRALCRFLAENAADFEIDTAGALAQRLQRAEQRVPSASPGGLPELPRGRTLHKARRLLEQAYKRLEARVPIALPAFSGEL